MNVLQCQVSGYVYDIVMDFEIGYQVGNNCSTTINIYVDPAKVATGEQIIPTAGSIVRLVSYDETADTSQMIFAGICGIPTSPSYSTGFEPMIYKLVCRNSTSILANRLVTNAWQNASIGTILIWLQDIINAQGVETHPEDYITFTSPTFETYVCNFVNLQSVLDELAEYANAIWWVNQHQSGTTWTGNKPTGMGELGFQYLDAFEDTNPLLTFNEYAPANSVQHKGRDYDMRTVQYVMGAKKSASIQVDYCTYDADVSGFITRYEICEGYEYPTIQLYNASGGILNYCTLGDGVGFRGIDDGKSDVYFLIEYGSNLVTYQNLTIGTGYYIHIWYNGQFRMPAIVSDTARIDEINTETGTSGIIESMTEVASNSYTESEAMVLAQNYIDYYNRETGEIKMTMTGAQLCSMLTSDDQIRNISYMTGAQFNLASLGIEGFYRLVEWSITPLYSNIDMNSVTGSDSGYCSFLKQCKWSLRFLNRDFMRSYAQTISSLQKDVSALSVRADENAWVIRQRTETAAYTEQMFYGVPTDPSYPSNSSNVMFTPQSLTGAADGTVFCENDEGGNL